MASTTKNQKITEKIMLFSPHLLYVRVNFALSSILVKIAITIFTVIHQIWEFVWGDACRLIDINTDSHIHSVCRSYQSTILPNRTSDPTQQTPQNQKNKVTETANVSISLEDSQFIR